MAQVDDERGIGYGAAVFSVVVIALTSYLTYAAIQGEYGLLRLFEVQAEERELRALAAELAAERARLANLAARLAAPTLDLDLLDERARAVLGLVRPDEIVIR